MSWRLGHGRAHVFPMQGLQVAELYDIEPWASDHLFILSTARPSVPVEERQRCITGGATERPRGRGR